MHGIEFGMRVSKMTNEEFLQRYDSGKPNFTEDEIEMMAYEESGNYVTTAKGETIFEVGDRLFAVSWNEGLTEMQENEFDCSEVYEVVKKEKITSVYIRKDTHD